MLRRNQFTYDADLDDEIRRLFSSMPSQHLLCPETLYYDTCLDLQVPPCQTTLESISGRRTHENIAVLSFDQELTESLHPSSQLSMSIKDSGVFYFKTRALRHDLTCAHLGHPDPTSINQCLSATDMPLSIIASLSGANSGNNLTPDYIRITDDDEDETTRNVLVIEYKTSMVPSKQHMQTSFHIKRDRYYEYLEKRIIPTVDLGNGQRTKKTKILFLIIIVSGNSVLSNVILSENMREELMMRFRIATNSINYLKNLGLTPEQLGYSENEDKKLRSERVKEIFNSITLNFNDPSKPKFDYISKEMYEDFFKPPDMKYVDSIVAKCMKDAAKSIQEDHYLFPLVGDEPDDVSEEGFRQWKMKKLSSEFEVEKKMLTTTLNKLGDTTKDHHKKSIIPFPWLLPNLYEDRESFTTSCESFPSAEKTPEEIVTPYTRLINCIKRYIDTDYEKRFVEDPVRERKIAMGETLVSVDEKMTNRAKYRRVRIELEEEDSVYFAQFGLCQKAHINHSLVQERKELQKARFSLNCSTDDIDWYMNNFGKALDRFGLSGSDAHYPSYRDFIRDGYSAHIQANEEVFNQYIGVFSQVCSTKLMVWAKMISDISIELSLAFKQHIKGHTYIVKKLRCFDVWIIIRPTKLDGPLFFMLLFSNELDDLDNKGFYTNLTRCSVFKTLHKHEDYSYSEWHSVSAEKITNWVKCESMVYTMIVYWAEFYKINPFEDDTQCRRDFIERFQSDLEAVKMLSISIMIFLENKETTESIITLSRFIGMEGFVTHPRVPKPFKMFKKLSTMRLHSRLQVWLINRSISFAETIVRTGGFKATPTRGAKVGFRGLINYFTGQHLYETWQFVNLMYLGYLRDKNDKAELNMEGDMLVKIVELEDKLKPVGCYGIGDPEDPERHEFSSSIMKWICNVSKRKLESTVGINFANIIEDRILHRLSFLSILDLSTLKASSNFNEDWYDYNPEKQYTRERACVSMSRLVDKEVSKNCSNPDTVSLSLTMDLAKSSLEKMEESGCMHICLFRKNQHGGLREIYVLGAEERVIQSIIETISKAICDFFVSETMTHPESKVQIPASHSRVALSRFGPKHVTMGTSADAEKWNQGHIVTKFMLLLCQFTPYYMHGLIIRGLSLYLRKRIMIDPKMIAMFIKNSDLLLDEGYLERIKRAFLGRGEERWMTKNKCYLQTTSGMMQGILHYTSSLLHTCYQETLANKMQAVMDSTRKKIESDLSIMDNIKTPFKSSVVSVMQSSDDSSVLLTFPCYTRQQLQFGYLITAHLSELKALLGKYVGIYNSVKTTANTLEVMEFNSEFYFGDSQIRPTMRWVSSALTMSEKESFSGRQEEMSTNLTSVLSGGGSFSLTAFVQQAQMLLHYRVMGQSNISLFEEFYSHLKKIGDPSLGFFLLDHPLMAGAMGFNYNLYRVVEHPGFLLNSEFKEIMSKIETTVVDSAGRLLKTGKIFEVTPGGAFVKTRLLKMGDVKRWKSILSKSNIPSGWREYVNLNPSILYRAPETPTELKLKLAVRLHSPGVAESLSQSRAMLNTVNASAYSVTRPVITEFPYWSDESSKSVSKTSLLYTVVATADKKMRDNLDEKETRLLFPLKDQYDRYHESISTIKNIKLSRYMGRMSKKNTTLSIFELDTSFPINPISLCEYFWFDNTKIAGHESVIRSMFNELATMFPWLSDDVMISLANSPFLDHLQLQNFLSRLVVKTRLVTISGVPLASHGGLSNILTAIRRNIFPGLEIAESLIDEQARSISNEGNRVKSQVRLSMILPLKDHKVIDIVTNILKESSLKPSRTYTSSRTTVLGIMAEVCKGEPVEIPSDPRPIPGFKANERIWESIKQANYGFFGTFDTSIAPLLPRKEVIEVPKCPHNKYLRLREQVGIQYSGDPHDPLSTPQVKRARYSRMETCYKCPPMEKQTPSNINAVRFKIPQARATKKYQTKYTGLRAYRGYFGTHQFICMLQTFNDVAQIVSISVEYGIKMDSFLRALSKRASEIGFLNNLQTEYAVRDSDNLICYAKEFKICPFGGVPVYRIKNLQPLVMAYSEFYFERSNHYLKLKARMEVPAPEDLKLGSPSNFREKDGVKYYDTDITVLSLETRNSDVLTYETLMSPCLGHLKPHLRDWIIRKTDGTDHNIILSMLNLYFDIKGGTFVERSFEERQHVIADYDDERLSKFLSHRLCTALEPTSRYTRLPLHTEYDTSLPAMTDEAFFENYTDIMWKGMELVGDPLNNPLNELKDNFISADLAEMDHIAGLAEHQDLFESAFTYGRIDEGKSSNRVDPGIQHPWERSLVANQTRVENFSGFVEDLRLLDREGCVLHHKHLAMLKWMLNMTTDPPIKRVESIIDVSEIEGYSDNTF